jgi:hypothetical protein
MTRDEMLGLAVLLTLLPLSVLFQRMMSRWQRKFSDRFMTRKDEYVVVVRREDDEDSKDKK